MAAPARVVLLDLDGVVYAGSKAIAGSVEAIARLRTMGRTLGFLTNNSTKGRAAIAARLNGLGIDARPAEVMTSADAAALFLSSHPRAQASGVHVVGTDELQATVAAAGVRLATPEECGAVLVGMDPAFNYTGITRGLRAVAAGASFVACNLDGSYPVDGGALLPGCGAMVGAVVGATGRQPDAIVGKPSPFILEALLRELAGQKHECIVVGDTLESDIAMANQAGVASVWISSTERPAPDAVSEARPTHTADSLADWVSTLG